MVLPAFGFELAKARLNPQFLTDSVIHSTLYGPEQAVVAGYLDSVAAPDKVLEVAIAQAQELSVLTSKAYAMNKHLLRRHSLDAIAPTVM
jgi:enoyl-CoA hydratase